MKPETEGYVAAVTGGYLLVCSNAQSAQIYPTWKSAAEALKADRECWKNAQTAEEAELCSPVEWK